MLALVGIWLCCLAGIPNAQAVTIDFTQVRGVPNGIPWSEEGFTVTSATPQTLGFGVSVTTGSSGGPAGGNPVPAGLLQFRAGGGLFGLSTVSAIVTNNLQMPFNLLSLDFVSFTNNSFTTSNYARIFSSAGGSFDLLGTPSQTTLNFSGAAWSNLSFVKVELVPENGVSSLQMLLDNFVVETVVVPEPSVSGFILFGFAFILFGFGKSNAVNLWCPK